MTETEKELNELIKRTINRKRSFLVTVKGTTTTGMSGA